jgi:ribose transport system substrate-binding protein
MKRVMVLSTILAVALVVASCATPAGSPTPQSTVAPTQGAATTTPAPVGAKHFKIGVATFTLAAPYFVAMSKAVVEEGAFFDNVEVIETDAEGDAAKLTANIEDLIAQGVDGIIVNAGPIEAVPAALEAIKAAGIPVVEVDRLLKGGEYNSWIGPDNYQIGVEDGREIVSRLGGQGVLLDIRGGPADNTIGLDRTNGMLSEVDKSSIEVIMAPDFGGWSEDGGFTVMEDMLAKHSKIDAVFCENDSMCLGAQRAISDAGRSEEMFLCAVDGQKEALKAIIDGTNYVCTGKNDSDEIGRAGFHRLMAILDTVLPSPHLTKDNACQYYNPDSLF